MTGEKILIVEDEGIVALDIKNRLEGLGYTVTALASSGEEAIHQAAQTTPDLVLMDIRLTGEIDGVETAERIRARFGIPVVYLTAHADGETLKRAKITQPFGYVLKPYEERTLHSAIEMALHKHHLEQRLKKSEERFRALIEHATDIVAIFERDGTLRYVSPSVERLLGYTPEELPGRSIFEFLHPEDVPEAMEILTQLLQNQAAIRVVETRLKHRDGSWRVFETIGRNRLDDPAIRGILINTRDATERVQAERILKESEEKFRTLAEQSPNMIFINQRGRVVYANERCEEVLGYTRDEFCAPDFDFMTLIPPEHRDLIKQSFGKHLRGEDVAPYEYELVTQDGQRVEVILNSKLIDYGGEKAILGTVTDITERKRMEAALQASEEKSRTLAEESPNMIFINKEGRVVYANKRCQEVMGYTRDEIYRQDFDLMVLIAPEDRALIEKNLARHMQGEEIEPYEYSLITRDGRRIESLITTRLINYEGEKAILGIVTDISERKRAEKALQFANALLVTQNEELDAFAHTVAHDLKNPLALVIGFAEALAERLTEIPEKTLRESLRSIARNGRKMDTIVNELLLMAQVREEEIQLEPLAMDAIVAEVQQRLAHLIDERQAQITLPPPGSWPVALGYSPWIEEVWANYLSNAILYGGQPPSVELGFDPPVGGEIVRFWIKDNGPGIPAEKQTELFVPFSRPTHAGAQGHGLGLSIVRRIVEKLGGRVGVESGPPGQGSVFSFSLPSAPDESEA